MRKINRIVALATGLLAIVSCQAPQPGAAQGGAGAGLCGFPQKDAVVLCDTPELRLAACNDSHHLFVQAILWHDGDAALGETEDGRPIGDTSTLAVDADADGKATAQKDRNYALNPWPALPGLRYSTVLGENMTTPLQGDSHGRGAIVYVPGKDGRKFRVDNYLIPLEELGRKPGDKIRFAYWGSSPQPKLIVNSIGYTSEKPYYAHALPRARYHEFTLAAKPAGINATQVPEGRETIAVKTEAQPMPALGSVPPEVAAQKWLNWSAKDVPSLKSLRGKVVLVEFWATWCGPCVAGIPHLNDLHTKYGPDGLVILSLSDQSPAAIEKFVPEKGMKYVVGAGSQTGKAYGVTGIPHAFLVDRQGKLVWQGHPADEGLEQKLGEAIGKK